MALGSILDGFWEGFGGASWGQVGSKIDKNGVQDDIQKRSRNKEGRGDFWRASSGPGVPWEGDIGGGKTKGH